MLAESPADAMLVAGGTDLLPNMKRRQQTPRVAGRPARRARASRGGRERRGATLGAGVTLTEIVRHDGAARRRAGAVAGRGADRHAAPAQHGHDRRQPLPRHALHLLRPELRVAQGDRLLHEEGRRHVLGRAVESEVPGGVVDRHGADAAWRSARACVSSRRPASAGSRRGPLRERRHPLPDAARRRGADAIDVPAERRAGAAPTGSCGAAASFDFPVLSVAAAVQIGADGTVRGGARRARRRGVAADGRAQGRGGARSVGALTDERDRRRRRRRLRSRPSRWTTPTSTWCGASGCRARCVGYALRELRGDDMRETRVKLARQALTVVS